MWEKQGNIRGEKGEKGDKGDTGSQGIQGVQGVQGIKGEKGDKGDKGDPGDQGLSIHDAVLNSPSELPEFSTAKLGDAWRVINTSGSNVTYDLYFKQDDGTTWSIQPNWGGVKGDKGDKGDTGETGAQGVQGIQGEKGEKGDKGDKGDAGANGKDGSPKTYFLVKFWFQDNDLSGDLVPDFTGTVVLNVDVDMLTLNYLARKFDCFIAFSGIYQNKLITNFQGVNFSDDSVSTDYMIAADVIDLDTKVRNQIKIGIAKMAYKKIRPIS